MEKNFYFFRERIGKTASKKCKQNAANYFTVIFIETLFRVYKLS